tara:strand:- start:543 stop:803 length:261 start_codon:yes stop_codon:yes gene_type:complete
MNREDMAENNPDVLFADGLDDGIIGFGNQASRPGVVIYDYDKCVQIFMKENNWSHEDAIEWMDFNVVSAYVGESTPIFITARSGLT